MNNEQFAREAERKLEELFKDLFFDVEVQRNLYEIDRFAEKDHRKFDSFVFIIMSRGQDNYICDGEGRTATLEQLMFKYKARNCKSIRGKPKLFFVQRFTFLKRSNVGNGSTPTHCSTDSAAIQLQPSFPPFTVRDNCPGEADFLLACVTSAVDEDKPAVPEVFFPQVRILVKEIHQPFAAHGKNL